MNRDEFLELHPLLFHMAGDGVWRSIQRHGLLSTTAILDLAGIGDERRAELEQKRRSDKVVISANGEEFVLRDQIPLNEKKLDGCLTDMTVGEWLALLNRKVFLWPTRRRCEELLNARAYRGAYHTIIEIDTATLLDRHEVELSPINTGATLYNPPQRGSSTFTSIGGFPFDRYRKRGKTRAIAEVTVDYSVVDVGALATGVWRAHRDQWVSTQECS